MNHHDAVVAAVLTGLVAGIVGAVKVVFAATDPALIAAILTAAGAITAGVFSLRAKASADLVDDVMEDRKYLREQVTEMRDDLTALNARADLADARLVECRESELGLRKRIAQLEKHHA